MKRVGYLYEKICDPDNVRRAIFHACQHKHNRGYVRHILADPERYTAQISAMLREHRFVPGENRTRIIRDTSCGKEREITVPRFYPDQIVHWAVIQVLEPVLSKGMYRYSCGSVPGRGGKAAKWYVEKALRKKNTRYVLKLDVRKFFPSVRHDKLKELLARKIKDRDVLELLGAIIDNGGPGLPIGYYTSQWLSNFYLPEIDHYIKEKLKVPYYVRYVDDMVLMGPNKRKLRRAMQALAEFMTAEGYGLTIKGNWQLWRVHSRPLDFVGYRYFRGYTLLREKLLYRLTRTVRRIAALGLNIGRARRFLSRLGWGKRINFGRYYCQHIKPTISKGAARAYVSRWERRYRCRTSTICPCSTA